jgi:hypothetical protein
MTSACASHLHASQQQPHPLLGFGAAARRHAVMVEWADTWEPESQIADNPVFSAAREAHERIQNEARSDSAQCRRGEGLTPDERVGLTKESPAPQLLPPSQRQQVVINTAPVNLGMDREPTGSHATYRPAGDAWVHDPQGCWVGTLTWDRYLQLVQRHLEAGGASKAFAREPPSSSCATAATAEQSTPVAQPITWRHGFCQKPSGQPCCTPSLPAR